MKVDLKKNGMNLEEKIIDRCLVNITSETKNYVQVLNEPNSWLRLLIKSVASVLEEELDYRARYLNPVISTRKERCD